jgi:hypothetical protein
MLRQNMITAGSACRVEAQAPKSAVIQGELRYRERYRPGAVGGVGGVAVRFKGRCNGALRGGCQILPYNKGEEAMQDKQVGPNPTACACVAVGERRRL